MHSLSIVGVRLRGYFGAMPLPSCRNRSRREVLHTVAEVQAVCGILLMSLGYSTLFAATGVGALAGVVGAVAAHLTRRDDSVLRCSIGRVKPLTVLWLLSVCEAAVVCLGLAACAFACYTVARPFYAAAWASALTAATIPCATFVTVTALYVRVTLPGVVEALYSQAALQAVRRLRLSGVSSDPAATVVTRGASSPAAASLAVQDIANGGPHVRPGTISRAPVNPFARDVGAFGDEMETRNRPANALAQLPSVHRERYSAASVADERVSLIDDFFDEASPSVS
jgi:hypothetical protein